MPRHLFLALLFLTPGFGFQSPEVLDATTDPKALGGHLITGLKPKYPEQAKAAGIQGTVVFQVLIDERGVPSQFTVLSPLGYGLDKAAAAALAQWRYQPITKNGKPVKVLTDVTFNFHLDGASFDAKAEKQRTAYNLALGQVDQNRMDQSTLDSLRKLAAQKFAPGMYLYGELLQKGRGIAADPEEGFRLIQEAAQKQYGPALYEVATARINGDRMPKDPAKGQELMLSAAQLGSQAAQWYLGNGYETGDGVEVDLQKSQKFFRMCAAMNDPACQFRLGRSLLDHSHAPDRDYIQAIAWLALASDHGIPGAVAILDRELQHLSAAQVLRTNQLKTQLVHKP